MQELLRYTRHAVRVTVNQAVLAPPYATPAHGGGHGEAPWGKTLVNQMRIGKPSDAHGGKFHHFPMLDRRGTACCLCSRAYSIEARAACTSYARSIVAIGETVIVMLLSLSCLLSRYCHATIIYCHLLPLLLLW